MLNASKYASTKAINAELGRCPIMHKGWSLSVKYLENRIWKMALETRFSMEHSLKLKWLITAGFKGCNISYVQMIFMIFGSTI